jgi:hypothetical protein
MTILLEVIAPLPESWGICLSCEMLMARANLDEPPYARGLEEYPPDWRADFQRLSELVLDLSARYGDDLLIRLYDPRSLSGLIRALRYRVHRYPTFVLDGRKVTSGWEEERLEQALQAAVVDQVAATPVPPGS